jgi:hypothetical protein
MTNVTAGQLGGFLELAGLVVGARESSWGGEARAADHREVQWYLHGKARAEAGQEPTRKGREDNRWTLDGGPAAGKTAQLRA